MVVAKFGGSSLKDASGYRRVAKIVKDGNIPIVIVSAPGGKPKVTDMLIGAYAQWEKEGRCDEKFALIARRFCMIGDELGFDLRPQLNSIKAAINSGCGFDYAVSRGEYLSAAILSNILGYNFIDARDCVKLTLNGKIDYESVMAHSIAIKPPCIIPGFYGKMPNGEIKLLPRGGSDISGATIAAAVGGSYEKWTDVDGIYDGRGGVIDNLCYDEAELLCYFGATVMQYEAIPLLKRAGLSLTIKNTFTDAQGTLIGKNKCGGFAFSKRKMFLCGNETAAHLNEISAEGLKAPLSVSLLGRRTILIDDCGFSPGALGRVLHYGDIEPVTVIAAIGNIPPSFLQGKLLFSSPFGSIYIER